MQTPKNHASFATGRRVIKLYDKARAVYHATVLPFQGERCRVSVRIPRALPWADMFEPFGLDNRHWLSMAFDCDVSIVAQRWQPEGL